MSKTKTIAIKVTTLVRVAPDAERERLSLHFKGESLARLLSMVDNIEAGNFYEAAKTYFQECSHDEREAVGEGMTSVVNGVADRESNKILWTEREPGQCIVETHDGFIDGTALDYPRYTLAAASMLSKDVTINAVLSDSPLL